MSDITPINGAVAVAKAQVKNLVAADRWVQYERQTPALAAR